MQLFKVRDFGDLLQDTFKFLGENWKSLFKVAVLYAGPFFLLQGIMNGIYQSKIKAITEDFQENVATSSDPMGQMMDFYASIFNFEYFLVVIFSILASAVMMAVTYNYVIKYEENNLQTPDDDQVRPAAFASVPKFIGYAIVVSLLVAVGFVFFVIPGIYLFVPLSFLFMIALRENLGLGEAFSRCFKLIKDHWWMTFGLLIIIYFIYAFASFLFQVPQMLFLSLIHI